MSQQATQDHQSIVHLLKTLQPIDTLSAAHIEKLADMTKKAHYPANKILFKRFEKSPDYVYLIRGSVDLVDAQYQKTSIEVDDQGKKPPLDSADPSRYTAVTTSSSIIITISRDEVDIALAWNQAGNYLVQDLATQEEGYGTDWMSALLGSELFQKIPPSNLQQLFQRFQEIKVETGEVIVQQGEVGDAFYVIQTGVAKVLRENDGETKYLATLGPGHYFGEEALIGDTVRNATVQMNTDGIVMKLGKTDFKNLLESPVLSYVSSQKIAEWNKTGKAYILLDVRLSIEVSEEEREGRLLIPLTELRNKIHQLEKNSVYVMAHEAGRRAVLGAYLLNQAGFQAYIHEDATPSP